MNAVALPGLSAAEVEQRRRAGLINRVPESKYADFLRIVARNLFTLFNFLVTPAAIALFALNKYQGALAVSGMAIVNTAIGLVHEIKAKIQLDRLAILTETKARVRRDGVEQTIASLDVVQDDLVLLASGESVVADGELVEAQFLDIDEALLTGESDPVKHKVGETLLSGSLCVAGEGCYRATRVGPEAFAQKTSAEARAYKPHHSPLLRSINLIVQILTYTAVTLCAIYLLLFAMGRLDETSMIENIAATITSMVPQGMVLMATIAFTVGAVYMSKRGALVQRLNAVEAMASIDVICTDKTGTLTTNRLQLDRLEVVGDVDAATARERLALFSYASRDDGSKTIQALREGLPRTDSKLLDQIPFKSQNRFSAVRVEVAGQQRVFVLGACEALQPHLAGESRWEAAWRALLPTGLRLLLFAESDSRQPLDGSLAGLGLRPLLLIALTDELRASAPQVLERLAEQGIAFKVISGDNPVTVRATISHLKLPLATEPVVSGEELAASTDAGQLVEQRSVFGRIAPAQKLEIVRLLQSHGRQVAMIGDGVNDVLPIKQADLGIAMGAGCQASKTVSGMVLETNDFALLPETLDEGRTIYRNLRRSAKLFLVKNVYSFVFILAYVTGLGGMPFPYEPQQVTLLNWLVIGLPALLITFSRERSSRPASRDFLGEVGWFAVRTGALFALGGWVLAVVAVHHLEEPEKTQRTLLLSFLILVGITGLWRALTDGDGDNLRGDRRFRWLGLVALPAYLAAMYLPLTARFFQLTPLTVWHWAWVVTIATATYGLTVLSDRLPRWGWRRA